MARIEKIVAKLPEAERVDVAEWGDHPTFRVRGKNFIFCDSAGRDLSVKLTKEEAEAVVATDPEVHPAGYGLGRHGWIAFHVADGAGPSAGGRSRSGPHLLHPGGPPQAGPSGGRNRPGRMNRADSELRRFLATPGG